jgi:hypothetical protein
MSGEDQKLCADPLLCGSEPARDAVALLLLLLLLLLFLLLLYSDLGGYGFTFQGW